MKVYLVKIMADRYPTEYRVKASSWEPAASRALRMWRRRFKRSRATTIKVHLTVLGEVVNES